MASEDKSIDDLAEDLMETAGAGAGDRLRAARETRRMELSHIAAETRIPVRHLEAIEASDFGALPARTYAIGFARTYARAVGLDEKSIADAVREELAEGGLHPSVMAGGMEPGDAAKLPSRGLAWFGGFAAVILAVGVVAFASTYFGAGVELPSLIVESDETDTAQERQASEALASEETGEQLSALSNVGQVVLTMTGDEAWVRFYEDGGERLFEGVMVGGDTFEVPLDAEDPRVNTGRPNLFNITIDGQSVPPLATEMVPVSDAPISAGALLARGTGDADG
ncbi:helix-turn-helix domain-containing protein [uncultured Erythrobacter sp.]|uniref:helix-turn-helix domain-containing protein n=1 Tax=uncultured Erythrobacter sp. TaxID=263913 RepID=UPI0026314649|nr:helix-turn-helix domain-containing protein [uncultured Erythrobacter sp.]